MSLPRVTQAPQGAIPKDFLRTTDFSGTDVAAAALVGGTLYVARIWPEQDRTFTKFSWLNGGTLGSSAEGLVFTFDGTNWNLVVTTGVVAQSGASVIQTVTGLVIPVRRSLVTYLGLIPNNATGFFGRKVTGAASENDLSPSGLLAGAKASVNQPCPSQVTGLAADIRTIALALS